MAKYLEPLKRISNAALDLLYPNVCIQCGVRVSEQDILICHSCWSTLNRNSNHTLAAGNKKLTRKIYFSFVAWRFSYSDNVVHDLIHHFKFDYFPSLHRRFGFEMAFTLLNRDELSSADWLVPVPLHRARLRERGYNQSLLMAQVLSEKSGIPVVAALKRIKNSAPQYSRKDVTEKLENVEGIFAAKDNITAESKRIILVDDIFTTGATTNECAKMLSEAGANEIMVLTTAFAQ